MKNTVTEVKNTLKGSSSRINEAEEWINELEMSGRNHWCRTNKKEWKDIGYYRDENGYIKFGEIPTKNNFEIRWKDD